MVDLLFSTDAVGVPVDNVLDECYRPLFTWRPFIRSFFERSARRSRHIGILWIKVALKVKKPALVLAFLPVITIARR
ncbi:hypothetical protein [Pseudomonas sp. CCOS 191]|uniref:hypothetical protein n=1 Tax=Pseudomonas sp. CCOS 191 TaxID=1649877 RepID=UPI0012E0C085|nr:hypothetical protein [Pseudomonas sp. CCOS 191]